MRAYLLCAAMAVGAFVLIGTSNTPVNGLADYVLVGCLCVSLIPIIVAAYYDLAAPSKEEPPTVKAG